MGEKCHECESERYGNNPEAPIMYACGSGYMTADNDPEWWSQSAGCEIIKRMKPVIDAVDHAEAMNATSYSVAEVEAAVEGAFEAIRAYRRQEK